MQVQILRIPNGHFALRCPLVQIDGSPLPEGWTHIELELGHLRILCALPEHPRPEWFEMREPRVSSWLRAQVHSGKLEPDAGLELVPLFDGVYRLQRVPLAARVAEPAAAEPIAAGPAVVEVAASEARPRPMRALAAPNAQPMLPKPRPIRRATRQSGVAARAS